MTLAELSLELLRIQGESDPPDSQLLTLVVNRLAAWKTDGTTPRELASALHRILGGIWLSSSSIHARAARAIEAFQRVVEDLPGMTMNERLFTFGLLDAWDAASPTEREALYTKLEATR